MTKRAEVPDELIAKLRLICLDLPDAYEENAWVGKRWLVRKKTFAHVLVIDGGWPPAYARAAGHDGPLCVLTFRSSLPSSEMRRFDRAPFFRPRWGPTVVGMTLDAQADWYEIGELLTRSYQALAPAKLAALIDEPQ